MVHTMSMSMFGETTTCMQSKCRVTKLQEQSSSHVYSSRFHWGRHKDHLAANLSNCSRGQNTSCRHDNDNDGNKACQPGLSACGASLSSPGRLALRYLIAAGK